MDNMTKRWGFFRHAALIFLEIRQVFLRKIALPDEKISRRWSYCHFPNKPWSIQALKTRKEREAWRGNHQGFHLQITITTKSENPQSGFSDF